MAELAGDRPLLVFGFVFGGVRRWGGHHRLPVVPPPSFQDFAGTDTRDESDGRTSIPVWLLTVHLPFAWRLDDDHRPGVSRTLRTTIAP
ncbi:hypothetical protein AB4305_23965 [Nocardia sp. 2YAB30]|uniref:hypothetical protein n=1 Tax=Nocardia sp. 2YAB30 TaxID=3233022 RepID=UPI003F969DA4